MRPLFESFLKYMMKSFWKFSIQRSFIELQRLYLILKKFLLGVHRIKWINGFLIDHVDFVSLKFFVLKLQFSAFYLVVENFNLKYLKSQYKVVGAKFL